MSVCLSICPWSILVLTSSAQYYQGNFPKISFIIWFTFSLFDYIRYHILTHPLSVVDNYWWAVQPTRMTLLLGDPWFIGWPSSSPMCTMSSSLLACSWLSWWGTSDLSRTQLLSLWGFDIGTRNNHSVPGTTCKQKLWKPVCKMREQARMKKTSQSSKGIAQRNCFYQPSQIWFSTFSESWKCVCISIPLSTPISFK